MLMKPYYEQDGITIYHGDCRDVLPLLGTVDVVVMDPPYGISYSSSMTGHDGGTALPGIEGDADTSLRDAVLADWAGPALVFGTWKRQRPNNCRAVLVWDKGEHVGMGDLLLPWKPNTEEIYVIGSGFTGVRGSSILRHLAPVSWNSVSHGRLHPHEKPVALMRELIGKCPLGIILDPFAGSGSTLRAAKDSGRDAIGIELEERYCEIAAKRLAQEALPLEVA